MTYRGQEISVLPIGGLNNGYDPVTIGETETPDCQNIRFRTNACVKRDGIAQFLSGHTAGNGAVQGMAELILDAGTRFEVVQAGGDLYLSSGGAWSSIKGALTFDSGQNSLVQMAQLAGQLCGTNNINVPWVYTGSGNATALAGAPATAQGMVEYKNYLVVGQAAGVLGKVQWSLLNNPASWPAANFNTFLNQGGKKVMGFGKMGDQLYVFMDRAIFQMAYTGNSTQPFTFPGRHPEIGSVSGYGIVAVDDSIYFPGNRGIYQFNGNGLTYIGGNVESTWRSINKTRLSQIVGIKNERYNEIWWAVSTGSNTQNDTVIVYDYADKKWSIYKMPLINAFGLFPSIQPIDPIVGGYAGQVWKANTGSYTDDGSAIDAYFTTRPNALGNPTRLRQCDLLRLIASSDATPGAAFTISTAYSLNALGQLGGIAYSSSGAVYDTAVWDVDTWAVGQGEGLEYTAKPQGNGRMFQAKVGNAQNNVSMSVAGCLISYRPRKGEG